MLITIIHQLPGYKIVDMKWGNTMCQTNVSYVPMCFNLKNPVEDVVCSAVVVLAKNKSGKFVLRTSILHKLLVHRFPSSYL